MDRFAKRLPRLRWTLLLNWRATPLQRNFAVLARASSIRQDGRVIHPAYLFRVKPPARVHQMDDVYDVVETIPAEEAFRPEADGGCLLVRA